jgi:hypothetical protein
MKTCTEKMQAASTITLGRSHDWVRHVQDFAFGDHPISRVGARLKGVLAEP